MTTISDSPVIYTSFLSVKLAAKPPVPNALPSILAVSNPPPEQRAFLRKDTLAAAPAVSGSAHAPAAPANAAAAGGDWKCFVDHLQQQGSVPGAAADDPERGVVTPANVSVKQMLAFLRNQAPSKPAWADAPLRQPSASMPSRGATVPIPQGADAASAELEAASPVTLLKHGHPTVAVDPSGTAALMDDMERLHGAADPAAEPAQAQLLEEERALDEELGALAEAQRPRAAELPMILEEDEENPFHASELFGTTPRREQARLRGEAMLRGNAALEEEHAEPVLRSPGRRGNVKFDQVETSRVLEVDAESGESVSVTDAFFLTKEHDGKWKPNQSKQSISPDQVSENPGSGPRVAAFAMPRVPTPADDSGFVVHSVFHEDRYDQPNHAEIGETFWADLGRDDEPAGPGAGKAFLQLQRLQELHRKLEAALRHNQQLKEEVGVYF